MSEPPNDLFEYRGDEEHRVQALLQDMVLNRLKDSTYRRLVIEVYRSNDENRGNLRFNKLSDELRRYQDSIKGELMSWVKRTVEHADNKP